MHGVRGTDPADVVIAWEAVEEILAAVPECPAKQVLRLMAAGLEPEDIATRLGIAPDEVGVLAARARIRILTAAIAQGARPQL